MNIPKSFSIFCDMAGIPANEAEEFWFNAQEDIVSDFLTWLVEKAELDKKQLLELEEVFNNVRQSQTDNFVSKILIPLRDGQKKQAVKIFSEIFLGKLEKLYEQVGVDMTIEQKQVANAYIEKAYV